MGRVAVPAVIENLEDLFAASKGLLAADRVRRVEVADALIDSGATGLLVPSRMVAVLGLEQLRVRPARTISGATSIPMYRAVRLSVQGRDCISDVGEIGDENPMIIGQVPLELMDWIIDMRGQRLIGNPAHGGEQMMEA